MHVSCIYVIQALSYRYGRNSDGNNYCSLYKQQERTHRQPLILFVETAMTTTKTTATQASNQIKTQSYGASPTRSDIMNTSKKKTYCVEVLGSVFSIILFIIRWENLPLETIYRLLAERHRRECVKLVV